MRNAKFTYRVFTVILAGVLLLSSMASAAESSATDNQLKNPAWKFTLKSQLDGFTGDPYHVPNSNTVYLPSYTLTNSATKVWEVGVVTAVDKTTGKEKWSYPFYKKGEPYPLNTSDYAYSKSGSVYALVSTVLGTKLHSVHSSGKSNWIINVPEAQNVYVMNDNTLLLVDQGMPSSKGKKKVYAYSPNGKKLAEQSLGDMYAVIGGQYLVSQVGQIGNSKLEVFGPKLNRLFTYKLPTGAVTYIDEAAWVINNGDILVRMNLPKTGNKLIAFNSKGKALWGRNIAGNASVQSDGQSYVVYANGEMSLYNSKGLVRQRNLTLSDPMQTIQKTPDNKLLIYSENERSVLDPNTLETIYQFPIGDNLLEYNYAGDGCLYAVTDAYKLMQYKLTKI